MLECWSILYLIIAISVLKYETDLYLVVIRGSMMLQPSTVEVMRRKAVKP